MLQLIYARIQTYGDLIGVRLSADNKNQLDSALLMDSSIYLDKLKSIIKPLTSGIKNVKIVFYGKTKLSIDWPIDEFNIENLLISSKDKEGKALNKVSKNLN